jgi:hypothetical protein
MLEVHGTSSTLGWRTQTVGAVDATLGGLAAHSAAESRSQILDPARGGGKPGSARRPPKAPTAHTPANVMGTLQPYEIATSSHIDSPCFAASCAAKIKKLSAYLRLTDWQIASRKSEIGVQIADWRLEDCYLPILDRH